MQLLLLALWGLKLFITLKRKEMEQNENTVWELRTPMNYPENSGCWEVVWKGVFMPFDVICGLDSCPPDNGDYSKYKKKHWWVCQKTKHDVCSVHDISVFIELPSSKEFKKLNDAIKYCLNWRKEWLLKELSILNPQ